MIHLGLRTEYSFKKCYGFLDDLVDATDESVIGIADNNNTFGHIKHHKICRQNNMKPILGVRLMVCDKYIEIDGKKEKTFGPIYLFIAKNQDGLSEIYNLVRLAYDQYYYHPRLFQCDLSTVSDNVIVIANSFNTTNRIDFIGIDQTTPPAIANWFGFPKVALCLNWYPTVDDRLTYQLHAGARNMEKQTYPQHILSNSEWLHIWPDRIEAINNTYKIADLCKDYDLPVAPMVKYKGNRTLKQLCVTGAKKRGIDLDASPYKERYEREIKLINQRNFADYFLIVAQMIKTSKNKMLVGPSRGSAAGSLVCYLIEITELDPIKFGLLFERFIDINRADLPDIDIDFPDIKRKNVIKSLVDIYGEDHVSKLSTISKMKPKSAIGEFAKALYIPEYETEAVKDSIIERSIGDVRALKRIEDTFALTEAGIEFIQRFPEMQIATNIEGHARHAGVHAAGIIVCNEPLTKYGGINGRDSSFMMDYKDAESLNLLKIDCLGLRTLSILESVADQIKMRYSDYYTLPLNDKKTFEIFNSLRLTGIFQFQGKALQFVTRQMGVENFDDICAITSIARPGPMQSGGTNIFINRRTGKTPTDFLSKHESVINATKATYGVIIYQEQLMIIAREYGDLSWEEVSEFRRSVGKSLGEEYLQKFKINFMKGAINKGASETEATIVWEAMVTFGKYGFNKSHAYSYSLISYWSAWAKAHHPLEFAVANLNHVKSENEAVKILRDIVRHDGLEHIAFDPDESLEKWSVSGGKLLGGLLSLKGIGPKKAKRIIAARKNPKLYTPAMVQAIMEPDTPFTILFPCNHWWGEFFDESEKFGLTNPPTEIENISKPDEYLFVGKLIECNLRDMNEERLLARRGGRYVTDHRFFLNMILEDDTDMIDVSIDRYKFEEFGREINDIAKVDHDWFLIKGTIKDSWRRINITQILNLNQWGKENGMGPDAI
jgi:DNA polymerase III alpha subunit